MDPAVWGVAERYQRSDGAWREAPSETVSAVLEAMGATEDGRPSSRPAWVLHPGDDIPVDGRVRIITEDGGEVEAEGRLPPDLPLGYHTVSRVDGNGEASPRSLIVSPGRCPMPTARGWGWAVQLYGVRSRASWGMGDLADLRELATWSKRDLGSDLLLLNPLHAALPGLPQTASPYFPSTRQFRNPLYLRVEDAPGAADLGAEVEEVAAAGRALNADRRIDRDAVYRLKMDALERLWERFPGDAALDAFCEGQGESLEGYATFCVLAEEFGRPWDSWPEEYRRPDSAEVVEYRRSRLRRVQFHQWLQWLVEVQLTAVSDEIPLIQDLAVGVDPAGADAWLWQDVLAPGISVGAPPDEFNTQGQDWGVPPFDPWRLRDAGYGPFVQIVRSALREGGGVRLDHVMGLFRLFWIPRGAGGANGTYVRYPASDLLDIVAVESERAGAYVVGEDLGTVEEDVRTELASRNVLSYRLLWFERKPPAEWPVPAMAAVTTHDLPTVAGLWTGTDLDAQRELGLEPNEEGTAATRSRLQALAGVGSDGPVEEVVAGAYDALGQAPCLLLAATLDDALAVEERPNMPGTTDEWPNWSVALPVPLEEIEEHEGPRRVAKSLRRPGPPC
ncbi:MAG: 4-alpha-glucanotransferase [Acidimicrobiales bacterium]